MVFLNGGMAVLEQFSKEIRVLYNEAKNGKMIELGAFRNKWGMQGSIGEAYQTLCSREYKKEKGSFYTPPEIVDFMVDRALEKVDFRANPMVKVLDPSCGGGAFLTRLCQALSRKAEEAGIDYGTFHVLTYNLFGYDTDETAVMISSLELYEKLQVFPEHITHKDFLIDQGEGFDIIIGNPPYMGHKVLTGEYRERLQSLYPQVFFDKGDIAYCFIKKSIDCLKKNGTLSLITSRYLLEALSGRGIRKYLFQNGSMKTIIDFYGIRPIKGAGVDTMIFEFEKGSHGDSIEFYRLKDSAKSIGSKILEPSNLKNDIYARHISYSPTQLSDEGWSFTGHKEQSIISKIRGKELRYFCQSYQGIITGCDKAFVLRKGEAEKLGIESELLKPWIKNSDIKPFSVDAAEYFLIYSNSISESNGGQALEYIGQLKDKLEKRRECRNGRRKWYELQWGRESCIFEEKKIVFPYKSSSSKFAIDQGSYFSADVYAIKIADMFKSMYTYEFLTGILNSSIYEFYIKTLAKKLGENMYEFYPNKIMTLRIPDYMEELDMMVKQGGENLRERIDALLCSRLGITPEEYEIIRSWCS
jgi:adenine-specific DNA-methyltransferase